MFDRGETVIDIYSAHTLLPSYSKHKAEGARCCVFLMLAGSPKVQKLHSACEHVLRGACGQLRYMLAVSHFEETGFARELISEEKFACRRTRVATLALIQRQTGCCSKFMKCTGIAPIT